MFDCVTGKDWLRYDDHVLLVVPGHPEVVEQERRRWELGILDKIVEQALESGLVDLKVIAPIIAKLKCLWMKQTGHCHLRLLAVKGTVRPSRWDQSTVAWCLH
jgi:hypothetical protein